MSSPIGVGFIGVGVISDTYLENLSSFPDVEVLILGDLDTDRARAQAEKHGVPAHGTAQDVLDRRLRRIGGGGRCVGIGARGEGVLRCHGPHCTQRKPPHGGFCVLAFHQHASPAWFSPDDDA